MPYICGSMLFIHIPKCGGHSVWEVMKQHGGFRTKDEWGAGWTNHQSAWSARNKLGPKWDQYQKAALVRNPWQRAVSLYFGRNKIKAHSVEGFATFMAKYENLQKQRWNPWRPQTRLLTPDVTVFKLEDIRDLYDWMEKVLGVEIINPEIRRTGRNRYVERLPYRDYFNPVLRAAIANAHAKEIQRFEWAF